MHSHFFCVFVRAQLSLMLLLRRTIHAALTTMALPSIRVAAGAALLLVGCFPGCIACMLLTEAAAHSWVRR